MGRIGVKIRKAVLFVQREDMGYGRTYYVIFRRKNSGEIEFSGDQPDPERKYRGRR